MAVTQYTGPRIVPMLANPTEWSSQQEYEPLTIVLHDGDSYTSRQYVPKGIDIQDERFWAASGNYNAQVEAYRQETKATTKAVNDEVTNRKVAIDSVNAAISQETTARTTALDALTKSTTDTVSNLRKSVQTQLDSQNAAVDRQLTEQNAAVDRQLTEQNSNVKGKLASITSTVEATNKSLAELQQFVNPSEVHLVTIGDSWLVGYSSIGSFTSWGVTLASNLGATSHYESYYGGCGFTHVKDSHTFLTLTKDATEHVADPKKVTHVVIGGGINDRHDSPSALQRDCASIIAECKKDFPNARIYVFPMLLAGRFICADSMNALSAIVTGCTASNVTVYPNCYQWIYDNSGYHADSYHPNQQGQDFVAKCMAQCIHGGSDSINTSGNALISPTNGYHLNSGMYIRRNGTICCSYIGSTDNVANGKPFFKMSKGYSPGAFFGSYTSGDGLLHPMNMTTVDDGVGFAPLNGNANQIYCNPSWPIEDSE